MRANGVYLTSKESKRSAPATHTHWPVPASATNLIWYLSMDAYHFVCMKRCSMTFFRELVFIGTMCCSLMLAEVTQAQHPWRPPFGLDRVGTGRQTTGLEADAIARPSEILNPVDLGTILVPQDWLLLSKGQSTQVSLAVISHDADYPEALVQLWFSSQPDKRVSTPVSLVRKKLSKINSVLEFMPDKIDRDELVVEILDGYGKALWKKSIPVMVVNTPPVHPQFRAVLTKLRYDLPISVRKEDGTFTTVDYEQGWDAPMNDVVVYLPGGGRFVFWRGASYVPFWAGRHNTGLSYEWAETKPPADGFKDCVEPLMDKELKYSRVTILESSASRIHVRWTYQSCDFNYKVWGDAATEDFYFYPDGFGTRVLTLQSTLDSEYELSEFIILTPPGAYPFSVLPKNIVEILFLDGEKRQIEFPYDAAKQSAKLKSRDMTAIYRVHPHKEESATAIYFHPTDRMLPPVVFGGFSDQGEVVTPCYWGSHWPLGRGQTTGGAIDNRMHLTPSHNSLMSWAMQQPRPLSESQLVTLDTLGRSKPMRRQAWAWLIGMSDDSDQRLIEWAKSFAHPPSLELQGAQFAAESYSLERRSIGLIAESSTIAMKVIPDEICVNLAFEIQGACGDLMDVTLDNVGLPRDDWAWDGKTLWINATMVEPKTLQLRFSACRTDVSR
jgi:hypothetical protein